MNVLQVIRERLEKALQPEKLKVINQSKHHANHLSEELPFYGQTHFLIQITSEQLKSLSKIEQHRKIFGCLHDLIPVPIHALSVEVLDL